LADTWNMVPSKRLLAKAVTATAILLSAFGIADAATSAESLPIAVGKVLPEVRMNGLNGPDRTVRSYAGHRLVINVWASWCGPCRAEAASLERFAWSERGMKFTVIGVSTDDDRKAAERWLRQSNATVSHFIDHELLLEHLLGASSIPVTVLIDERGQVVGRFRGAREWDSAESVDLIERTFANSRKAPTQ
jgi:thiol-disulfide isomerase/thioredoxin